MRILRIFPIVVNVLVCVEKHMSSNNACVRRRVFSCQNSVDLKCVWGFFFSLFVWLYMFFQIACVEHLKNVLNNIFPASDASSVIKISQISMSKYVYNCENPRAELNKSKQTARVNETTVYRFSFFRLYFSILFFYFNIIYLNFAFYYALEFEYKCFRLVLN